MSNPQLYKGLNTVLETHDGGCVCVFVSPFSPEESYAQFMPDYLTYDAVMSWVNGELIQNAMPNLTPEQRDQFLTGVAL